MATLNEVKEEMLTVASVGDFSNALQQIATARMMKLRQKVLASRPFVDAAVEIMRELAALRDGMQAADLLALEKKHKKHENAVSRGRKAIVVVTSNAGLTGRYNLEIYARLERLASENPDAEYFVIGKKGQESFANGKFKVKYYPYEVKENFTAADLRRIVSLFDFYPEVMLLYSRYVNSAKRDVVVTSVVAPELEGAPAADAGKQPGKYFCEPDVYRLVNDVGIILRAALFQQQIMDARLSQNAAQMIGMKTAADNAVELLGDLRMEYNKQRRKMIDKKISEVFAGSALW